MKIGLRLRGGGLLISVEDDGVGLGYRSRGVGDSSGGAGLRIHAALLAAIGASLELAQRPSGGVQAQIFLATNK